MYWGGHALPQYFLPPPATQNGYQPEIQLSRKLVPFFFNARVRKYANQYAILTPSQYVPPALLTFNRHLPVTKADVLYFCTKKPAVKTAGGTYPIDGVGWRRLRCARRHARGHKLQRCL